MRSCIMRILLVLSALLAAPAPALSAPPLVLAAASLQESLTEAAAEWQRRGHERPILSFAASSALARQIQSGAPADIFVSADEPWMDSVEKAGLLRPATRKPLLRSRLALIAPRASTARIAIGPAMPLGRALGDGRLALADPDAVPAGRYARAALEKLRVWPDVSRRIARAENVRAALALVERGEAPFGIVYSTDARASAKVRLVGLFPANSHPPIVYPIATLKTARSADAEPFRRFLVSPSGRAIFARYGFVPAR